MEQDTQLRKGLRREALRQGWIPRLRNLARRFAERMCSLSSCCAGQQPDMGVGKRVTKDQTAMDKALHEPSDPLSLPWLMEAATQNSKPLSVDITDVDNNLLTMDSLVKDTDLASLLVRLSSSSMSVWLGDEGDQSPSAAETVHPTPEAERAQPTPEAETVQPTPGAETVQPTPGAETVQPTPGAERAQPTPEAETVQLTPGAETVQPTPGAETIQPTPEAETVQPTPEAETVQPSPEAETVQPTPGAETVQPTPEAETVQPTPGAETVQPTPGAETVQPTPEAETVQPIPEAETVQPTSEAETVQPSPEAEIVQPTPEAETVQPSAEKETVQPTPEALVTTFRSTHHQVSLTDFCTPYLVSSGRGLNQKEAQATVKTDDQSDDNVPDDLPGHISSAVQQWVTQEVGGALSCTKLDEIDNKVRHFLSVMKDTYVKSAEIHSQRETPTPDVRPGTYQTPDGVGVDVPPGQYGHDSFKTPRSLIDNDGSVESLWPSVRMKLLPSTTDDEVPGPSGISHWNTIADTTTTEADTEHRTVGGAKAGDSEKSNSDESRPDVPNVEVPLVDYRDIEWKRTSYGTPWILGTGSFGTVQAAYIRLAGGLKIPVAIKEYLHDDKEAVMKEGKMMQYLNNTDVFPKFYGFVDVGGLLKPKLCLVSELFGMGVTLADIMRGIDINFQITTVDWLNICTQLVKGLKKIHELDVIFNDLKDNNVLVDISSLPMVVKYIDLGYSSLHHGITFLRMIKQIQSCRYIAPEVKCGEPTSFMSDIWGLGNIFSDIALVCGSEELEILADKIQTQHPQKRISLDEILMGLVIIISDQPSQPARSDPGDVMEDSFM